MENIRVCNICGSGSSKLLFEANGYKYGICKQCGHVYQITDFGGAHYIELPYQTQKDDYITHSKRRAEYISYFIGHDKLFNKDVLDIGCGRGGVLYFLQLELDVHGLGISPDIMDTSLFDTVTILNMDSSQLDTVDRMFNVITMIHSVEHFQNPLDDLMNIRSKLKDDGVIYIEVPSFNWVNLRTRFIYSPEHISYFHKKSISNLLNLSGFEIIKYKESKYWGNIKIVAKKSEKSGITFSNYKAILKKHTIYSIAQRYYRLRYKYKTVTANE